MAALGRQPLHSVARELLAADLSILIVTNRPDRKSHSFFRRTLKEHDAVSEHAMSQKSGGIVEDH